MKLAALHLFIVFLLLNSVPGTAQTATIGTGIATNTSTTYPAPYGQWFTCSKHQMLVLGSELQAGGLSSGQIRSLGFNVSVPNGVALQGFTIKMKQTTDSSITGFDNTGLSTVYGPQNYTDVAGWNMHYFSTPFIWDGTSNVIVETCFCNGVSNWSNNAEMFYSTTGFGSVVYTITDGDANHCSTAAGPTISFDRPNMRLTIPPPIDAGVTSILSPVDGCSLTNSEPVTIVVSNLGTNPISSIAVYYQVDTGAIVMETMTATLLFGSPLSYTFSTPADLSVSGIHTIKAWSDLTNDTVATNDSIVGYLVENLTGFSAFPLMYDVESAPTCLEACGSPCPLVGLWQNVSGDDIDWTVDIGGTPSVATGPSLDNTTRTATGKYLYTEASGCDLSVAILESPCLDLSATLNPTLKFAFHMFGDVIGQLNVEVYTGGSWINVFSQVGEVQLSETEEWVDVEVNLSAYPALEKLRFKGTTGTSFNSDIAIDDILVFDKPLDNVGVVDIIGPFTRCELMSNEDVIIEVTNFGVLAQDTIPVAYSIDGSAPVVDTIFGSLAPGATTTFTFAVTADLSALGTYNVEAWTALSTDTNYMDDSTTNNLVVNIGALISSFPSLEDMTSFIPGTPGTLMNGWTNVNAGIMDWTVHTGLTPTAGTGPNGDHTTGSGVYLYTQAVGNANKTAELLSPCIDLDSLCSPVLELWYHMYGANMGNLSVEVFDGVSWITIGGIAGQQQTQQSDPWQLLEILIPCSITGTVQFRFLGTTSTGSAGDICIDDIALKEGQLVSAEFSADTSNSCTGSINAFADSNNACMSTMFWDFGDGNTDSISNPLHTYTDTGLFTVSLIVSNNCSVDTVVKVNYFDIEVVGATVANCVGSVLEMNNDIGIHNVTLNTISNNTGVLVEGYTDYSCTNFTTVMSGSNQLLEVETGATWKEFVRAWIDYNDDGDFDASELVMSSDDLIQYHSTQFMVQGGGVLNKLLRMRIASDFGTIPPGPCDTLLYGQVEDYGITVTDVALPPEAIYDFVAQGYCPATFLFTDNSTFFPTAWVWDFDDGTQSTGSASITHVFPGPGTYNVSLVVTNSFGDDTLIQTVFIDSVVSDFTIPDTAEVGANVPFQNTSYGADTYSWDFGDLLGSPIESPNHSYGMVGMYVVNLVVTSSITGCSDSKTDTIYVQAPTSLKDIDLRSMLSLSPNPSNGVFLLSYNLKNALDIEILIFNMLGEQVYVNNLGVSGRSYLEIDLSGESQGVYMFVVKVHEEHKRNEYQFSEKILIQR